jgi:hypothetical protein
MRKLIVLSGYLLILAIHIQANFAFSATEKPFVVFDATLYSNKPDLSTQGIVTLPVIYQRDLWPHGRQTQIPDQEVFQSVFKQLDRSARLICLDVEHWPVQGEDRIVNDNIGKYRAVAKRMRAASDSFHIGYYGVLPVVDYWRAIRDPGSQEYQHWHSENVRLLPLAAEMDVIFPSLYTFYSDQDGWQRFARAQVNDARMYQKPVYVFLWPEFHDSNRILGGHYIGDDYWRKELETAFELADGIVIWGGWGGKGPANWSETASWWRVVKQFMSKLHQVSDAVATPR